MGLASSLGVLLEAVVDKNVVLIIEGTFEQGFVVIFQIGDGREIRFAQRGLLPPDPELPASYEQWQQSYRGLDLGMRLSAKTDQVTNVSVTRDCNAAAQHLRDRLNAWLNADSFRPLREKWLEKLQQSDSIRVIIQTENYQVQKLPWHLWDLIERFPQAEIGFSTPAYEQVSPVATPAGRVNVLAILGNSQGIDTQADRALLQQLPQAEVRLLAEPTRQELSDRLWDFPWDILFFAGHSSSQADGETGCIYINQTDSLSLSQLKNALKKSLERGLKLAIFNSCDGLGLARELADLHIPQVIVMREPVPDQVAQAFLKYFLPAYAAGAPLYIAVRQARERLQVMEEEFPCATWLPVIFQNPAEQPLTWQQLAGVELLPPLPPVPARRPITWAIAASLAVAALVAGVRYLGVLQSLELTAFDQLMRLRPEETSDPRLLVITINDADIQAQRQNQENLKGTSLSDPSLAKLLGVLMPYQPRVIGLDLYRDFPVDPAQAKLGNQLRQTQNLVGVCKTSDKGSDTYGIAPPPEVPPDQLGFSDFVEDAGRAVRRQILFMQPEPGSPCLAPYSFSMQLVARYLEAEGKPLTIAPDKNVQFGDRVLHRLQGRTSGYQQITTNGNSILLNYRATRQIAETVPLSQVLAGQLDPNAVKDKIVLVGVTADSSNDKWRTPYTSDISEPGVFVQAHMVSQILSTVLDGRPLLQTLPQSYELLWTLAWSLVTGMLVWRFKQKWVWVVAIATTAGVLLVVCLVALVHGVWLPIVPPLLALVLLSFSPKIYAQE